jgi:hypothetical protein
MGRWLKRQRAGVHILTAFLLAVVVFILWYAAIRRVWLFNSPLRTVEWDLWSMLEGLSSAAAFAAVVGGGLVALLQLIESVDSRHLGVFNDVFERMMDDAEVEARRWIYLELPKDPKQGIASLTDEDRQRIKRVLNSFDHLGLLLKQDWVTDDGIIRWVSPIVIKTWDKLGPYVAYECEQREEPYYYEAAQYLAQRCAEWWEKSRRGDIKWLDSDKTV